MYIMGDVNIDLSKYHSHQQTERYLDMIYSLDLLPVITKPTRITNHTATLIDLTYTNNANRLTSGIVTVDISDHLPVFCISDTPLKKQNRQNTYFRDFSKFNTESYLPDIHTIDWKAITEKCDDLHEVRARTSDAIELIVKKHAPKRKLSRNQQLIKRNTKSQTTPLRIAINNKTHTNNEDIADQLNKHFINVGPNLASKIDKSNENPTQYISSSSINSFVMADATEAQVSILLKNLDTNLSSIVIPDKLIKKAAEPLSGPFTQIYNQSIETGMVPKILKVSQVTPVYKSGDATDPANYRPISTLSSSSKVFEKLIYNQLYIVLEKYTIL